MKKRINTWYRNLIFAVLSLTIFLHVITAQPSGNLYSDASPFNPIIKDKFTADPAALVVGDTVFIYTGHDEAPKGQARYVMHDWLCYSSTDMVHWTEHPSPMSVKDFAWAKDDAWASQVIYRNGKYYWYAAMEHGTIHGKAIGIGVSNSPTRPFKDAIGKALITNDMTTNVTKISWDDIDPTVMIDKDGQAYLFWGNTGCYYAKLKENMIELDGPIQVVQGLQNYTEAPWIHKKGDWYYLSYAYQFPEKIAYAMSKSITGPWQYKGILNEGAGNTIFRAESATGTYSTIARNVPGTSFVDNTPTTGGTFYYAIKAVDKSLNRSAYSNQVVATPTANNDLVEYLPFNSNLLDTSINLNHSAILGTAIYTTGKVGTGALILNGSTNFLQLPATVANQQAITIAAWVNWSGGNAWQRLFDLGNSIDQYLFLTPKSGDNTLRFAIKNSGAEQQLNATALTIGTWTHVAITMGATGVVMFVNGTQVAQSSAITIRPTDFMPVLNYIGRSQYADALFNGSVDEFKIFNYALSAADIQQLVTPVILPLTWGGFTAEKRENTSLLTWTTLKEHNVSEFIVQKSIDGKNFNKIGLVKAAGESNVTKSYSLSDATPIEGINYYRIQQVDKDGQSTYSAVKTLSFDGLPAIVTISPNPVKGIVSVSIPGNNKFLQAVLLNSTGQRVDAFVIKGQYTSYDLSKQPAGVYYLQIQGADVNISKKLVITR